MQKGFLTRAVTARECPWLHADLPKGKEVYGYDGYTYGCISDSGVAVSDEEDIPPFYEVPADAVSWNTTSLTSIILPTDTARVAQLREKLAEYQQRLKKYAESGDAEAAWGTVCKIAVLGVLLEDGMVDIDAVREVVLKRNGEAVRDLRNAFDVISDYCITGGKNTVYGTGLPSVTGPA